MRFSFKLVILTLIVASNTTTLLAQAPAGPAAIRYTIERYDVIGSNPLSTKTTQKILADYLGEHEGLEGVQAASDALESVLREKGYSFHRVVLPPQTLQQGSVKLEIVEFKLGKIEITNNKYFDEANIRKSLPVLQESEVPNMRKTSRSLRFANLHPGKKLKLAFRESETQQAINAIVEVEDKKPGSYFSILQNTGTEETGEYRLTLGYQYSNLFNRDQVVSVLYTTAEESDAVQQFGVSYRIPFYSHPGQFSFNYTNSDVETGQIADFFQVSGKGTVSGLTYQYFMPNWSKYRHNVSVSYEDKLFENNLTVEGQQISGSGSGDVRTTPFNLTYSGRFVGVRSSFGFSVKGISNQAGGSASDEVSYNLVRANADPDWAAIRYGLNYDWRFAGQWMLRLNYVAQQAGEPLVPGEQFGLGGANSIRGYEERSILGDNGWQLNTEFWAPPIFKESLHTLIFYDQGEAEYEDFQAGQSPTQEPASVGVGLRWSWNDQLSVRADFASVLETVGETEDGDTFLHFSLFYRF